MGFHVNWIKWVMSCVGSVSYNLVINGQRIGHFTSTRGLRQRDPISPYLFLLMVDTLSKMIVKESVRGNLEGIKIKRDSLLMAHLLFANDAIFFLKAIKVYLLKMERILNLYCQASSQSINSDKSSLIFSASTPSSIKVSC